MSATSTAGTGLDDVLRLASALIRTPSPNPPGDEVQVAALLADWLAARGVDARQLPVDGPDSRMVNVFGRVAGAGRRPPLVLCGHLDTVPAGAGAWQRPPLEPEVVDGRLYGLGACDMKAAVAAMSVAAVRLARETASQPLEGDLLLAFTSTEETRSFGARAFAASGLLDGAAGLVIGEPTGNRVGLAEKGGMWLELVVHGRTSHGSLPHLGANAASGLAAAVHALDVAAQGESAIWAAATPGVRNALARLRAALMRPAHPLLGAPTLAVTRLESGVANNVVPDRATVTLDIRTLPDQDPEALRAAVAGLVEAVIAPRGLRLDVMDLGTRAALDVASDHPLVAAARQAVEDVLGVPAKTCGLTGATDATELVPPLGLPFVICGPGEMAQAHQPDEFVAVDALAASVEIYYRLARHVLAGTLV